MNLVRVLWPLPGMAVLLLGLAGPGAAAVAAEPTCLPPDGSAITVLARPGVGHPFVRLEPEGGVQPFVDGPTGRAYVPVRALVTAMTQEPGAVSWDEATRTATFSRGDQALAFTFVRGSHRTDTARLGAHTVPVNAFLCSGKLFAPARSVAGALGAGVKWYRDRTVVVDPTWLPDPDVTAGLAGGFEPGVPDPAGGQADQGSGAPASSPTPPGSGTLEGGPAEFGPPFPAIRFSSSKGPARAGLPPEDLRRVADHIQAGPAWTAVQTAPDGASCGAWPKGMMRFVVAPAQSTRQAARSTACHLVRGW